MTVEDGAGDGQGSDVSQSCMLGMFVRNGSRADDVVFLRADALV
jgi:hypothetical protein